MWRLRESALCVADLAGHMVPLYRGAASLPSTPSRGSTMLPMGVIERSHGMLLRSSYRHLTTCLIAIVAALALPILSEHVLSGISVQTAEVVSGETVELEATIWSPWRHIVTIQHVTGGCFCTTASISPMTITPWSRCVVGVVFDSRGKPVGNHSVIVSALDTDGIFHELPVRFDVTILPAAE